MHRLSPEQLPAQLQRSLSRCYLLCGQDLCLQQESQQLIRQAALAQGFTACPALLLEPTTEWRTIEQAFHALPLFAGRQLLPLILNASAPNQHQIRQLTQLPDLLDSNTLLMLLLPRLKKSQEQAPWFTAFSSQAIYITCHPLSHSQWPGWIRRRAQALGLRTDPAVIEQLCYYYEGNLLALGELLKQLALCYPDGQLTLPRISHSLQDKAQFTPQQWLNALLLGQIHRVLHSLQQLQATAVEPLLLLRILQDDLLLLIDLKRQNATPLPLLFERYGIWQSRHQTLTAALQRLADWQLRQALYLLTQLERRCKKSEARDIWQQLQRLSLLLCGLSMMPEPLED